MRKWPLAFVAICALLVSACGFRPLYGQLGANPGAQRIFASIYVEPIDLERVGYELRNSLIDLLEASSTPRGAIYHLAVSVKEKREGAVLQNQLVGGVNETTIARYNYTLIAQYKLTDAKGATVTSGSASTLSAYNVVTSPYATQVAQQDARKRASDDIAQRIRLDLGVYFAQRQPGVK
ncbi:MAG: hypothetical protein GC166_03025 [Alphaproteobacteria bacterium]|nr:hypothetical protein [Alphaproteobacteria bacterium]